MHGDVHDPGTLDPAMADCQAADYLVHSLNDADFERLDAAAAVSFGRAAALGRAGAHRLPRRARRGRRLPVGSPAQPPPGREAARLGRGPGDRHPGRDHRRARRHFLGTDPPARRAPARHDHAQVGRHPHPADRGRRRCALPDRGAGAAGGGRRVFEAGGPEVLQYATMLRRVAAIEGRRCCPILPVPLLTPRLSSLWLTLVTDIDTATGRALIDSMTNEVVVRDSLDPRAHPVRPHALRRRRAARAQ